MNQEVAKNVRGTLVYLSIWVVIAVGLFLFLKNRESKLYTTDTYEQMLTSVSKTRPLVSDPCLYAIYGDPPTADNNFAKVFLFCNQNEKTANSFDLVVLKNDSYEDLLTELGRINSFNVIFIGNNKVKLGDDPKQNDLSWKCFSDHIRISDFNVSVKKRSRVECFFNYSDLDIQKYYAKN